MQAEALWAAQITPCAIFAEGLFFFSGVVSGGDRKSPKIIQITSMPSGGAKGTAVEPSLVDAALICKEFLNLRHVIECGLLSGLFVRPDRCRWPRW
jgi:hypothetical protein